MRLTFVETPIFTSRARSLLSDRELHALQMELLRNPSAGDLIGGSGGVRKIRVASSGRGKRGGARVIYCHARRADTIYLLIAYAKNEAEDITLAGRKHLKKVVELLAQER